VNFVVKQLKEAGVDHQIVGTGVSGGKMSEFELTFGHQLTLFLAGFIVVFIILKVYFKW